MFSSFISLRIRSFSSCEGGGVGWVGWVGRVGRCSGEDTRMILHNYIHVQCMCTCNVDIRTCTVHYTVETLNNVTFGTSYFVHYREVPFFGGYKCVSTNRKATFWCSECCPLFGVSFNGGSTVHCIYTCRFTCTCTVWERGPQAKSTSTHTQCVTRPSSDRRITIPAHKRLWNRRTGRKTLDTAHICRSSYGPSEFLAFHRAATHTRTCVEYLRRSSLGVCLLAA